MKQKRKLIAALALLLAVALGLSGCGATTRAQKTTLIASLRYGVSEDYGLYKVWISLEESGVGAVLTHRVYPKDTPDSLLLGVPKSSHPTPLAEGQTAIGYSTWEDVRTSDSLISLWKKDWLKGDPELCGANVLYVELETATDKKTTGGYTINNQALYEVSEILRLLSQQGGAAAIVEEQMLPVLEKDRRDAQREEPEESVPLTTEESATESSTIAK